MIATSESRQSLVSTCIQRDKADDCFRDAVREARLGVKPAPGGRRAWIFHQLAIGGYNPQRAIYEFIDLLVSDPASSEQNVAKIGQCFIDYAEQQFAVRDARSMPSVRETLQLSVGVNAEEMKADAALIAEPESLSAIETAINATERDVKVDEEKLSILHPKLARIRFGRQR